MVFLDVGAYSEHVKTIRCDIKPKSVEKFWDVENEIVSKKSQGYTLKHNN
jgi:hypothetical protein